MLTAIVDSWTEKARATESAYEAERRSWTTSRRWTGEGTRYGESSCLLMTPPLRRDHTCVNSAPRKKSWDEK